MTKLDKPLKCGVRVKKESFVLTCDPEGFRLTKEGRRKRVEIVWKDLVSGEAAMAVALSASLGRVRGQNAL